MRFIFSLVAVAVAFTGCQSGTTLTQQGVHIASFAELKPNVDRYVILIGRYHNPGKGERILDCGFARLPIGDYSLYSKDKDGYLHLHPSVEEGTRIEVRALLKFHPRSRILEEELEMVQDYVRDGEVIEVINGRRYVVRPSSYSIVKVRFIRRVET